MKKIVVIPARGGSKRIPRKNIKSFYGKPIISYSLDASSQAGIFDCIHVSTEDQEIYEIASQLGFKPAFLRSKNCAGDNVPIRDVLIETVQQFGGLGKNFDIICLLSATAPLINANDLKEACMQFEKSPMEYPMLAATRYPVPIEWALRLNLERGVLEPDNVKSFFQSSHNFQDKYYDVGSFAFFTKNQLLSEPADIKFIPYILPQTKSVDVDNMEDWIILEKLYAAQIGNKIPS
jgi:pseudaminic acid cytidylyltransferase